MCTSLKIINEKSTEVLNAQHVYMYNTEFLKAHALLKCTCNGKYTEDFIQKTETNEKEGHYLTLSRIPGSV